ncbi:MAG: hypothetical protein D3908_08295 [Candidatus Electrothrix sp. AUS4]|nr:hypothetical protein [Candidatus Electrothrix sp. AUS4]
MDNRRVQFGGILEERSVFLLESKAVVLSARGGLAVFFEGLGSIIARCSRRNSGDGNTEKRNE